MLERLYALQLAAETDVAHSDARLGGGERPPAPVIAQPDRTRSDVECQPRAWWLSADMQVKTP